MKKVLYACATGLAALMTVAAVGEVVGDARQPQEPAKLDVSHLRGNDNENENRNRNRNANANVNRNRNRNRNGNGNANANANRNRNRNRNRNGHMMSVQSVSDVVGAVAIFGETNAN